MRALLFGLLILGGCSAQQVAPIPEPPTATFTPEVTFERYTLREQLFFQDARVEDYADRLNKLYCVGEPKGCVRQITRRKFLVAKSYLDTVYRHIPLGQDRLRDGMREKAEYHVNHVNTGMLDLEWIVKHPEDWDI